MTDHQLTATEHRLFEALQAAYPQTLSRVDLESVLYGDREDGGPEWGSSVVLVTMHRLRKKLSRRGWRVVQGGYRLERAK